MSTFFRLSLCLVLGLSALTASDRIAVLDLDKVFQDSAFVKARSEQLKSSVGEYQEAIRAKQEELDRLETELKIRPKTHKQYPEFLEKYEVAKLRMKMFVEGQQQRLNNKHTELLKQSYQDVRTLLLDYAKERNLALILMLNEGPLAAQNINDLKFELGQRSVLFHSEDLDITADFTTFADSRLAAPAPAPAPAAPAPAEAPVQPPVAPAAPVEGQD